MAFNKEQQKGTGGGPYKQKTFSPLEEAVIELTSLNAAVDGVAGAKSFCNVAVTDQLTSCESIDNDILSINTNVGNEVRLSNINENVMSMDVPVLNEIRPSVLNTASSSTPHGSTPTVIPRRKDALSLLQEQTEHNKEYGEKILKAIKGIDHKISENLYYVKKTYKLKEQKFEVLKKMREEKRLHREETKKLLRDKLK